jgi:hypothetical protein
MPPEPEVDSYEVVIEPEIDEAVEPHIDEGPHDRSIAEFVNDPEIDEPGSQA